jgi:hypothetical protein
LGNAETDNESQEDHEIFDLVSEIEASEGVNLQSIMHGVKSNFKASKAKEPRSIRG